MTNRPKHQAQWKRLADMPVPKWEPASIVLDNKMYVHGGYENGIVSGKNLHVFDPEGATHGSWKKLQDLPSSISHVNLAPGLTGFWFAGGMKDMDRPNGIKDHIVSEVWHFDPELDRYSAGPLLPGRRAGGGLVRLGDNLHYISGLMEDRDTDSGDHWVFNLKDWDKDQSAQWEKLAPLPNPRNQLSVTVLNDKIYIIGGQYNHDLQQLDQPLVHIYDASKDTWSDGPSLPYGHSHSEGATFTYKDRIWMVGGHTTPEGGTKGMCENVITLTEGEEWEITFKLPVGVSSPASKIINDELYVAGGWDLRMLAKTPERDYWADRQVTCGDVWVTEIPY